MSKQRKRIRGSSLTLAFLIALSLTSCVNGRLTSAIETSADADECAADLAESEFAGCRVVARVYDVCSY